PPAEGESCAAAPCGVDLFCNTQSKLCEKFTTNPLGMPCGLLESGGIANCAHPGKCKIDDLQKTIGTCVAAIADAEVCSGVYIFAGACEFPASCISGACGLPGAACN